MVAPSDVRPPDPPAEPAPRRRSVDRRTLAICLCIALAAALAAALVTSLAVHRSSSDGSASGLTKVADVDRSKVLTTVVHTYAGRAATIRPYLGRPAVVNLWSSTCSACISEMPTIDGVYRADRSKVAFVGMDVEEHSAHDGEVMLRRTKASYPSLWDRDGTFLQAAAPTVLPTTLFLDARGKVVYVQSGAMRAGQLRDLIATKLHVPG